MSRRLRWFSEGAASAVATLLDIREHGLDAGPIVTCSTGSEDEDNGRFRADCEPWFGTSVTVIKSEKYESTWDVWEKRGYMAGINGAVCTGELKFVPRLNFQLPSDTHVFGYTADRLDVARAKLLRETYPDLKVSTPLIDARLTKANCLALVEGRRHRPAPHLRDGLSERQLPSVRMLQIDVAELLGQPPQVVPQGLRAHRRDRAEARGADGNHRS